MNNPEASPEVSNEVCSANKLLPEPRVGELNHIIIKKQNQK
jgi:hypothetical protein